MTTRKTAAALALIGCLTVVSACSADEPDAAPPELGGSSETSPAETPSVDASPSEPASAGEFDDRGHDVLLGDADVADDAQQEVVDAWLRYWQVRLDAYAGPELDPAALGEVASGAAAEQVISYVRYLQSKGLRTEGDIRLSVDKLRIRGDRAVVTSCGENLSVDVRRNGKPAETLKPYYTVRGTLSRVEGNPWQVTDVARLGIGPC